RSPRTLPRPQHRPLPRSLRLDVPLRLVARPHLSRSRVLPSPAFRRRVRRALPPVLFLRPPPCPRRPSLRHTRARPHLRPARLSQHPRLRGLRLVLRFEPHLSPREWPPPRSTTRRRRVESSS